MENTGKKKPCPRRSFTPEFKTEIVELCRRGDRSVGQIAKDFDPTETAVRDRAKQAEVDAGQRDGLTSSEREELAALRRENRRLREDVDILKAGHLGFDRSRQRSRLVWNPRHLRGRLLSFVAMASRSSWLSVDRFVPLGRYCRSSLLVFSVVPRCQRLRGLRRTLRRRYRW
ncbi:transposase [Streptomyces europaeiscabiei]|uniref:transposase n=1 Tax=Streptomyces europaeiscabiei TaxID=146819 RepID=UPI0013C51996